MIENAKITNVSLNFKDHGVLTLDIIIEGCGWGCCFGGRVFGSGYLGAKEFKGSEKGIECIMRIMDVIGVEDLFEAKGKYIRVQITSWGGTIEKIGNIISDKWFSYSDVYGEG